MPLINESSKYAKENPSRDDKPRILGLQKNGGCFFPSYHAQKQNLAESETKDFDLVPTIASTEGSKQKTTTTTKHPLGYIYYCSWVPDPARYCLEENPTLFSAQGKQPLQRQPQKDLCAGPDFSTLTYFLQSFVSWGNFPHRIEPLLWHHFHWVIPGDVTPARH